MGTDNLGGAYLQVGADISPLVQKLQAGQREVNTTMQRMGTSVKRFSLDIGGGLSKAFGFAGFVGAAGTMALATREAVKQLDAQKRLSVAVGTLGLDYRKTSQAVAEYTETAKRSYAISRAQAMDLASLLMQEGKFGGANLQRAFEASLGLSTLGGTSPEEAARFLIGARFGQPVNPTRFGMEPIAEGAPGGAFIEQVMAHGRAGLGMQRELARLPQEAGRRALVNALDRLAEVVKNLVDRFGVVAPMFEKHPEGAPGILEPGESPFTRAAADVVDAKIQRSDQILGRYRAALQGTAAGLGPNEQYLTLLQNVLSTTLRSSAGKEGLFNTANWLRDLGDSVSSAGVGATDWMQNLASRTWQRIGLASEGPERWVTNSLDQLDEATQPNPFSQADILERAAGARSNALEAGGGGTPEQRGAQGGVGPYLQTPIEDNTKALNSLTDALHSTGGLQ